MHTPTSSAMLLTAVERLGHTGGLVVLEAGPGLGATFALRAVERHGRQVPRPGGATLVLVDIDQDPDLVPDLDPDRDPDRRSVTVVVATAGVPWPASVAALAGRLLDEGRVQVLRLPPPDDATVAELLRGDGVPEEHVAPLVASAAGNPLVARHLARTAGAGSTMLDRVVLARLLDRFGTPGRAVADVLAVLGSVTPADLALVAKLAELSPATVAEGFDALVAAGVLTLDGASTYRIAVPWVAGALRAGLGPALRERLHRGVIGSAMAGPAPRHELAARHLLDATTAGEADVAMLLDVAGALSSTRPALAADCYRRALDHLDGAPERVADVSARLARASLLAGRPDDTVDVGRPLLDDPEATSADLYPWLLPVVTEAMKATSAVEEAEAILRGSNGGIDELLDTHAAYLFAASGRDGEARERIRRARGTLTGRSARGRVNMLSNILHAECIAGDFAGLRDDAATLARTIDATPADVQLHGWATLAHVRSVEGDLAASSRAAGRAEELLRGATWGIYVPGVRYARAAVAFARGDWETAVQVATAADEPLSTSGTVSYLHLMRNLRARVLANRGEFIDARRLSTVRGPAPQLITAMQTLAAAEIELLEGRAQAAAERLAASLGEGALPGQVRAELLAMAARAAAACGDRTTVGACWSEVEERFGVRTTSRQVRLELQLARALGEESPEPAHATLQEATEHGFRLFEGRALLALGRLGVAPESHLNDAMKVFGDLRAVPWRRSTATELRDRGLRVPRRPRTSDEQLTETEIQLARLVQAARSNKEIAGVMSLSVKTVEVYLSRLYVKVGCKNRLDLARAADEGRLPLDGPEPAPAS